MGRETRSAINTNHAAVRVTTRSRSSVLRRLINEAHPEMLRHVLDKLPPEDRAMVSFVDRACRASVGASGLPLAGGVRSPFVAKAFTATVERLRWARANGCPWDPRTWWEVAKGGHLEVLKWGRENGCPWDALVCAYAAQGGHLEMLKWMRENGCPWDASTCQYAAEGGHLGVLKWARDNGCPWDAGICAYAAEGGHLEVL